MPLPAAADALAAPARLRSVVPGEHPYPGVVVAGDPPRVWVDADDFRDGPAWRADPDGHVLGPLEVARTPTDHAVVLPLCTERLREAVVRRAPLSRGEVVTVAVSLLRGAVEADDLGASRGEWWVTDAGRPVLALTGETLWRPASGELFALLGQEQDTDVAEVLERCRDAVADPRHLARDAAACEDALFALAEPAALGTRLTPVRARDVARAAPASEQPPPRVVELVARWLDAGLPDRLRAALPRKAPAAREPGAAATRRRRAPWLLGVGLAGVIVMAGLLWPDDAPSGAEPPADPSPSAPSVSVSPSAPPGTPEEERSQLLDELARCVASPCGDADPREDPRRAIPAGIASDLGAERRITLLDEYGGVSVLRVESGTGDVPPQIAVIVRDDEKWLVRDVYDVADQP